MNLINASQNLSRIAYFSGSDISGRSAGIAVPLAGTMTWYVMCKRKPMIFDASNDEEMTRLYPEITARVSIQAGFRSNMMIPPFFE